MAELRSLVVVLGDQLDLEASAFDGFDAGCDAVWMAEVAEESTHVASSLQRTALFQNEGVTFTNPPSVDDIAARWSEIDDLSEAKQATFSLQ